MKTHYKCDNKLKIYAHAHTKFYERNLKRAKKLYLPNDNKKKNVITKNELTWNWKEGEDENVKEEEMKKYSKEEFEMRKRKVRNVFGKYFRKDKDDFDFEELMDVVNKVKEGKKCWLKNEYNERDYEMRLKGEEAPIPQQDKEEEEEEEEESDDYTNNDNDDDDYDYDDDAYEINEFKPVRTVNVLKHNNTNKDNYDIEQITYNHNLLNSKYEQLYNINDEHISINNNSQIKSNHNDNNNSHIINKSFTVSETDINNINRILFPEKIVNPSSSILTLNNNNNDNYHIVKIQMKYRRHKREAAQPKQSNKIYYGWNSTSTHSIFLYIYNKDKYNNVISLYTKIYSLSHQQMHEDVFTIPELKVLGIIDKQVIKDSEVISNSEDIAMKILKVFDKAMLHRHIE